MDRWGVEGGKHQAGVIQDGCFFAGLRSNSLEGKHGISDKNDVLDLRVEGKRCSLPTPESLGPVFLRPDQEQHAYQSTTTTIQHPTKHTQRFGRCLARIDHEMESFHQQMPKQETKNREYISRASHYSQMGAKHCFFDMGVVSGGPGGGAVMVRCCLWFWKLVASPFGAQQQTAVLPGISHVCFCCETVCVA